jgi:GNAT superfamily N-acetyltransferase
MPPNLIVTVESPRSAEAAALLAELDSELLQRYPRHAIHGVELRQLEDDRGFFVVARLDGRAVGCGAVRVLEAGVGEIKRMFVRPEARRRGVARAVLAKLEETARERGFYTLRLETGARQPEAIALYETHGYYRIPCFGEYATDPFSACYEKQL